MTCLPRRVSPPRRVLEPGFRQRHRRVFSWLVVLPMVYGDRANLQALARHGPAPLAYQPSRRRRWAAQWGTKTLRWWVAEQALQALPPPQAGLLQLVGDRTLTGKRGSKHPVAHKTRLRQDHPSVCGFRIVLLMAQWDGSRIPVAFARIRRTDTPDDQPETALFRRMRQEFRGPPWGQEVVVTADAAYASRANRAPIQALGHWDVRARPRTWQFANGQAVNDPVLHLPRGTSPQSRMPPGNTPRRRTFGVYAKRGQRRHLGDVTGGLRTWRRHAGPKQPTIPVTHLPEPVTARESGGVDLRRWGSELLRKELTGGVGLGQQQVTQKVDRVEPSVAVAIMAYLLLLKLHAKAIPADRPWRAFRLQRAFAWEVIQEHGERSAHQIARKWLQLGKAA